MDTSEEHSQKCGLGGSHPGDVSTGDSPKAWLAQNPTDSTEKTGNAFSRARLGVLLCWDGGTPHRICPCFHLGLGGCPCWARSGMGHPRSFLDFHGRRRGNGQQQGCALGVSPLSIQAVSWMGRNGPGHDPGRTQRDKATRELWRRTLEALGMAIPAPACSAWTR